MFFLIRSIRIGAISLIGNLPITGWIHFFINEGNALINKILIHLGLWETRNHDPPQSNKVLNPTMATGLADDCA